MKNLKNLLLFTLLFVSKTLFGQVSVPVDAGDTTIVKKDSLSYYAKVYKRVTKSGKEEYFWYTVDSQGRKSVNGGQVKDSETFTSLALAKANLPLHYSIVVGGGGGGGLGPEPVENINTEWERTVLPGLIAGTNDVSGMNRMELSVFPSTPVAQTGTISGVNTELIWGDGPIFKGNVQKIIELGLATGFDHNRSYTTAEVPASKRSTWNTYFDGVYAALDDAGAYTAGSNEADYMFGPSGTRRDKNNQVVIPHITHIDIETADWRESASAAFHKGFYDRVISTYDPNHVVIIYGKPTIRQFKPFWRLSQYYYDSDPVGSTRKYLYPFMKSVNYTAPMGSLDSSFYGKNYRVNILYSYPSAPLILNSPMYKTVNGVIQTDSEGERDFIDYGINEVQRGVNFHWEPNEGHENDPVNPDQGPYKWWIHEGFLGAYQGYAHYSNAIFSLQTLLDDENISTYFQDGPIKTCWVNRTTNESNSWSGNYRPLDRYTSKLYMAMGFMFTNAYMHWAGWTGTYGFSDDGSDINPLPNEGTPYPMAGIEGLEGQVKNVHLGAERQSLAAAYYVYTRNRDYGLYTDDDLICTFADPYGIQPKAEILGLGRLHNNVIDLLLAEPRLEVGETLTVTIGNTVTGQTFTRVLNEGGVKDPLWETFVFTGAGTLNASQVWIQYQSIKGITVKKNGLGQDI